MKVVLIEDNLEIIEAVLAIFQLRWPETNMLTTTNGEKGIELVRNESPDLIIIDLGLPDINGFQVLRAIREFTDKPVVILTAQHEEIYIIRGLELGADDYITKPFSPGELLARIRAVMRRYEQIKSKDNVPQNVPQNLTIIGNLRIDVESKEVVIGDKHINLSPRAYDMLAQLVQHKGEFVPIHKLMEVIAAPGENLNAALVKYLIKKVNEDFKNETNVAELIVGDQEKGYKLSI